MGTEETKHVSDGHHEGNSSQGAVVTPVHDDKVFNCNFCFASFPSYSIYFYFYFYFLFHFPSSQVLA